MNRNKQTMQKAFDELNEALIDFGKAIGKEMPAMQQSHDIMVDGFKYLSQRQFKDRRGITRNFRSECKCGQFAPQLSGQSIADSRKQNRSKYKPNTGQVVCGNCGLQDPR